MKKHLSKKQVDDIRREYAENKDITVEYLADKYDRSVHNVGQIIANTTRHDPAYTPPANRRGGGVKKKVYIPDHLKEDREEKIPHRNHSKGVSQVNKYFR